MPLLFHILREPVGHDGIDCGSQTIDLPLVGMVKVGKPPIPRRFVLRQHQCAGRRWSTGKSRERVRNVARNCCRLRRSIRWRRE